MLELPLERQSKASLTPGQYGLPKFISLAEAARIGGLSAGHLRTLVREGHLRGEKIGRNWVTTTEAVNEYLKLGVKPGPKRKRKSAR